MNNETIKFCECETVTRVARDMRSTCGQCGGIDAYKKSKLREGGDDVKDPLEKLRFFCSLGMYSEDWFEAEIFFTDLQNKIKELEKELETVRQKLTDSHKWEVKQQSQIEELRNTKFKEFLNEECWLYELGGDNLTYSLVCPVVISADDIREIEKQLTKKEKLNRGQAIYCRQKHDQVESLEKQLAESVPKGEIDRELQAISEYLIINKDNSNWVAVQNSIEKLLTNHKE